MIVIHDNIHSLHFINDSGDLIIGIGDHLYQMSHLSCKCIEWHDETIDSIAQIQDLPKVIVFKTVSMQFAPIKPEKKEREDADEAQLIRMSSEDLIRLKKAHKADQMFVEFYFPHSDNIVSFAR